MSIMETLQKTHVGRPRGFDRDKVLNAVMRLFWRHGYEGVSFQQLTDATGLAAPSLYAAFGNKEALYLAALDRYDEMRGSSDLAFMDGCASLTEAARLLLEATARGVADPTTETGCMLNMGMITSHPDNAHVAKHLADRRNAFLRQLRGKLRRWVDADRAKVLARHLAGVVQGMAIQAHDGASAKELLAVAREATRGLENPLAVSRG